MGYNGNMENKVEEIIAQNLIKLRKGKNLKQSELSKEIGYSDKTISRWENGSTVPDIATLIKLSEFYNISLEELTSENAVEKHLESEKRKRQEEMINKYSVLGLSVLTVWTVAAIAYIGLIMINQTNLWQIFIMAIPVSCLMVFRTTRKIDKLQALNFIMLSLASCAIVTFFYLVYLQYNFWQLFILIVPLEGVFAIKCFFPNAKRKK